MGGGSEVDGMVCDKVDAQVCTTVLLGLNICLTFYSRDGALADCPIA